MKRVSTIVPVYNEEKCIERTFDEVVKYCFLHPEYDFIFVNDGSEDSTKEIILQKINSLGMQSQITLISYENNYGKGYAVRYGVKYSTGDYVCFIDADLAYSLEHLNHLAEKLDIFDVVIGSRPLDDIGVKNQNILRKISGKIFNLLSRKILNLHFNDMQAGLKGFRLQVAKQLFQKQVLTGFAFDVELIYIARKYGYYIGEIPAKISESHLLKKSKVNLIKDSIFMFYNLLQIRINDWKKLYE
ncbi:MAG TPA: glycosyltransferase [Halomicronema sp.]